MRLQGDYNSNMLIGPVPFCGVVDPSDEDMIAINSLAKKELSPGQIYVFSAIISTESLNCYSMQMTEGSLANFVKDAQAGNPLLTGHNTNSLPIGRSFDGQLQDVDGLKSVVVKDYMLRGYSNGDVDTDKIAQGIDAGLNAEMSIGYGGIECWLRCAICNRDLYDKDCPHIPGLLYDGVRAKAFIENARLLEHSVVYAGADPGAVILKAESMFVEGKLSKNDVTTLEDTWQRKLKPSTISIPRDGHNKEESKMTGRELLAKLRAALTPDMSRIFGLKLDSVQAEMSEGATVETALAQIAKACEAVSSEGAAGALAPYRELGVNSVDDIKALQDRAKLADDARADLVKETLAAGVRAQGDKFDNERWTRVLAGASVDDIKAFRTQFEDEAKQRLGEPGRQTTAPDPNAPPLAAVGEFDKLSPEDQEKQVKAFIARTGRK